MTIVGPNTDADSSLLREKTLLCNGEDEFALLTALAACGLRTPNESHAFRSYRFWRFHDLTVILSPMGTGPLEALLWEILSANVVEEIVLVGTAGQPPRSRVSMGAAHYIHRARVLATGLDAELGADWQTPAGAWPLAKEDFPDLDYGGAATILSTDLYYGLSPSNSELYLSKIRSLYVAAMHGPDVYDLIDMETAQFYALCSRIPNKTLKKYLAFKGAANTLDDQKQQNLHTFDAILACLKCGMKALATEAGCG